MWIVRLALSRPYTIAVLVIAIVSLALFSLSEMLIDIFPVIDIPVVAVVWNYPGLPAIDMERRVILLEERAISSSVNGVARIESQSIPGIGILRIYFESGTDIGSAIAQIGAVSNTVLKQMPPGIQSPMIIQFNASNLPVAQLTVSSDELPESTLFDYGLNFLRIKLFTIPGLSIPAPYGGQTREITIDVDPNRLTSKGLSASDMTLALEASNLILPAGTARIGHFEYSVALNSSPKSVQEIKKIPVKGVRDATLTLEDLSQVRDGHADQTNIVRINGKRASFLNLLKKASASTLKVIDSVKKLLPELSRGAPEGMKLKIDFDQSVFVKAAIGSVIREALIASFLVSLMIFFFLGSFRSVIIVCASIPLALFCAVIGLHLSGNTLNMMTLGGLSLAIGMLVDDATVEVENIHRNRHLGLPLVQAILHGAEQIALPAIMATLAICIVFFPVLLLTGPARFLFIPMALSVVFSMLASYVLSRSLVPLLSKMLMANESLDTHQKLSLFLRFEELFEALRKRYSQALSEVLDHRAFILWLSLGVVLLTGALPQVIGQDFFPSTDTGIMKIHVRATSGSRLESTEAMIVKAEEAIREIIPSNELDTIHAQIGVPTFYNLAFVSTDNVGAMDTEFLISLKENHAPTDLYVKAIRESLRNTFPGSSIYFQAADIVSQVLNFGLSAPIDIQIEYPNLDQAGEVAETLMQEIRKIPGAEDIALKQVLDYPTLKLTVDRLRAFRLGITQHDIAHSLIIALSSSTLISPSFFLNPINNVNYPVAVKVPLEHLSSTNDILQTPITSSTLHLNSSSSFSTPHSGTERLGNLATLEGETTYSAISHSNVQRVLNVTCNVQERDLGSVSSDIQKIISKLTSLPPGMKITVRGQGQVMQETFQSLGLGLCVAALLIYLLMVVLFQSWLDPLIVMVAIPGAMVGILWMLLITGTTINVSSFMGAIMAVGIAASNAILLVSFANEIREEKKLSPLQAALEAGKTRLRPVLMTALAMILGMLPTALALGEGGEQNAPLGRAVVGGLLVATLVTLFLVPTLYSLLKSPLSPPSPTGDSNENLSFPKPTERRS